LNYLIGVIENILIKNDDKCSFTYYEIINNRGVLIFMDLVVHLNHEN